MNTIKDLIKSSGVKLLSNSAQYKYRMEIKSQSSNRLYIVAYRLSNKRWECSCPGWIFNRRCKHLASMGIALAELERIDTKQKTIKQLRSSNNENETKPKGRGKGEKKKASKQTTIQKVSNLSGNSRVEGGMVRGGARYTGNVSARSNKRRLKSYETR